MKVKATKVMALSALKYVTEGKMYDSVCCFKTDRGLILDIIDDEGDRISVLVSDTRDCAHGVKWEVVE